jgi:hypothetical protein
MQLALESYVFLVLESHLKLCSLLGDHAWRFDMEAGRLTFTSNVGNTVLAECPVQILGSFSLSSRTWLWGWANERSQIPPHLVSFGNRLRDAARKEHQRDYHNKRPFPLARENQAQEMALVAAGFAGMFTFYYCETADSGLYFGIEACAAAEQIPRSAPLVESVLTTGISSFAFQHQQAVETYLGAPERTNGQQWEWLINHVPFQIIFDQQGRIAAIEFDSK